MLWPGSLAAVHLDGTTAFLVALAGLGAGVINGVAGGGTLLSFPVLLALGYPALGANVTSTIGIWPGYVGGTAGFRREVSDQRHLVLLLGPCTVVGALAGSLLLLTTPASTFEAVAPWLVLAASLLFATQPLLTRRFATHSGHGEPGEPGQPSNPDNAGDPGEADGNIGPSGPGRRYPLIIGTAVASVYGGYFGAGLGVILLAVLGLTWPDTILRTSGLRTVLSVTANGVAALVFIGAASPYWEAVGLLAAGSLVGGFLGTSLLRRLPPLVFRALVVAIGLVTAIKLLIG